MRLSPALPIFSIYRELMKVDPQAGPLLSLSNRVGTRSAPSGNLLPAILGATIGDRVRSDDLQQALTEAYPHQYSANNIGKIARNAASSWTQSGHLTGRTKKIRTRVAASPSGHHRSR